MMEGRGAGVKRPHILNTSCIPNRNWVLGVVRQGLGPLAGITPGRERILLVRLMKFPICFDSRTQVQKLFDLFNVRIKQFREMGIDNGTGSGRMLLNDNT